MQGKKVGDDFTNDGTIEIYSGGSWDDASGMFTNESDGTVTVDSGERVDE